MKIFSARWVLPIVAPPIPNGSVAVDEAGIIRYVGPTSGAPGATTVELGDALLLPGLVNAHSHLDLTALRGAISDVPFFDWIRTLVGLKSAFLNDTSRVDSACVGIAEGLRAGITCYGDTADSTAGLVAMRRMSVRGVAYQEVFGPDPDMAAEASSDLRKRVTDAGDNDGRVGVGLSPHAPYTVSDNLYSAVAELAEDLDMRVAAHIAESADEFDYVTRGSGAFAAFLDSRGLARGPRARSPIQLLHNTGLLGVAPLLIHVVTANDDDIALIRKSGSTVVHCPRANERLGHAVAPVPGMIAAGITVALGSDSVVSNDNMDILAEAQAAMAIHTDGDGNSMLAPRQLLEMMTLSGARALGLGDVVGSLEVGKFGDLCAFGPRSDRATLWTDDPEMFFLQEMQGSDAVLAAVGGEILMRNGVLASPLGDEQLVVERISGAVASGGDR